MKILTGSQQPTIEQQPIDSRADRNASGATQPKSTMKAREPGYTVELSSSLGTELKSRQAAQTQRIESIKSLVTAGTYQVNSRSVAEKMIAAYTRS